MHAFKISGLYYYIWLQATRTDFTNVKTYLLKQGLDFILWFFYCHQCKHLPWLNEKYFAFPTISFQIHSKSCILFLGHRKLQSNEIKSTEKNNNLFWWAGQQFISPFFSLNSCMLLRNRIHKYINQAYKNISEYCLIFRINKNAWNKWLYLAWKVEGFFYASEE